jgi:peptidase M50B-like protein
MPRPGGLPGSVRFGWHYVSMTAASLGQLWHHLAAWADRQGHPPSHLLILGTGLLAAGAVASRRAWPVARTVVTIAHEGGHALAAVVTGRRLHGVRVLHTSAGVTMTEGSPSGPGIVLTSLAGYVAAPLLGLGGAALLAGGHLTAVLVIGLAGLAGLVLAIRNAYGLLAVLAAVAVIVAVLWQHSAVLAAALGYVMTWLLLFGGVRPVLELRRDRRSRRGPANDADQLARLTGLPGGFWVGVFGLVAIGALGLGGWLLVG